MQTHAPQEALETATTQYQFDYDRFLTRMKHPACRLHVVRIRGFIHMFNTVPSSLEQPLRYREFMDTMGDELENHPVWLAVHERHRPDAREGLEYLVCNQIYARASNPQWADDGEMDVRLREKMVMYAWLRLEHLDVHHGVLFDDEALANAREELSKMQVCTTPRDKLLCVLAFCRVVQSVLESQAKDVEADLLMPVLIWMIVRIQPTSLYANLKYVQRYRDPRQLASEAEYQFTSMLAAVTFIERLDQSALVVDRDEFSRLLEDGVARLNAMTVLEAEHPPEKRVQRRISGSSSDETGRSPSPDILEEGRRMYQQIKESQLVAKSMGYLSRFVTKAESVVREALASTSDEEVEGREQVLVREQALRDEEEYHLQLALALSLSEVNNVNGSEERASGDKGKEPLLDSGSGNGVDASASASAHENENASASANANTSAHERTPANSDDAQDNLEQASSSGKHA